MLSGEEVSGLLSCVSNIKHRTFLLTLYAAGLRLSEAAALTIADIDSQRMQLRIAHGKGAKERLVPLSPRLLAALREYSKSVRPPPTAGRQEETASVNPSLPRGCRERSRLRNLLVLAACIR